MNLAILIGVSGYADPGDNLPGCKNDIELIESILRNSNKFSDTLKICEGTSSAAIKSKLSEFVTRHKKSGEAVEELFFYYTGHGDTHKDDFYYLPSDFDPSKRQQTGLSNAEVDTMLRSLGPHLTAKIIDACHSGVTYIKQKDAIDKVLQASKSAFKKCYFMFSSQKEEASYQSGHLSDFSKAFALSIHEHKDAQIRYKDILDFISDSFASTGDQTPAFVVQADLVEAFCDITPTMRSDVARLVGLSAEVEVERKTGRTHRPSLDLVSAVKEEAKKYCSKEECLAVLGHISTHVGSWPAVPEVSQLFDHEVVLLDKPDVPNQTAIGKWLKEKRKQT